MISIMSQFDMLPGNTVDLLKLNDFHFSNHDLEIMYDLLPGYSV